MGVEVQAFRSGDSCGKIVFGRRVGTDGKTAAATKKLLCMRSDIECLDTNELSSDGGGECTIDLLGESGCRYGGDSTVEQHLGTIEAARCDLDAVWRSGLIESISDTAANLGYLANADGDARRCGK